MAEEKLKTEDDNIIEHSFQRTISGNKNVIALSQYGQEKKPLIIATRIRL